MDVSESNFCTQVDDDEISIKFADNEGIIYQLSKYQVLFLPILEHLSSNLIKHYVPILTNRKPTKLQNDTFHLTAKIQPMFHEVPNVKSSNMAGGKGSNGPSGDWWTFSWSGCNGGTLKMVP